MSHSVLVRHAAHLCALLVLTGCGAEAAKASDRYDAAVAHAGRTVADVQRDATDLPADMLRLAGIAPGMRVADVLAGDGYYSELVSYIVGPTGKVLMINNQAFDDFSDALAARLAGNRLPNVEHMTVDLNHMNLPKGSLDAVLLIKVYHDLYWVDPKNWPSIDVGSVLDQLSAALKPNGVVLVVDHSAKPGTGNSDATRLHRIDEAYAVTDFAAHGFKVVKQSQLLKRPDDPRNQLSYKGPMYTKTDRFVLVLRKF